MIIACDPGANGAFVWLRKDRSGLFVLKTAHGYASIVAHLKVTREALVGSIWIPEKIDCAGIEQIGIRQGDTEKAHAIKELNQNVGRAKLCFELACIEYQEVDPKTWQYKYGLVGHKDKKAEAKKIAQSLFPQHKVTLADADALLIADYLWHITYNIPFRVREPNIKKELTITRVIDDAKEIRTEQPDLSF